MEQSRWGRSAPPPGPGRARALAAAARKPLLERPTLPEEFFAPLMAASVHDPDPSFCRWFVEPAVYSFGRRRVCAALLAYLRDGTDAERLGAMRAWYSAWVTPRAERSPAYGPGGVRDPAIDETRDIATAWLESAFDLFATTTDLRIHRRLVGELPLQRIACPPHLQPRLDRALGIARAHADPYVRHWAADVDRGRPTQWWPPDDGEPSP
ncbi:hypothetical protein G6045_16840 [Streptomyces sp. YC504]|uniref:HEAT repeat domain-containing protein n=1 Tax=Streptomyces mesophilus TaxID=1775132 RepID=A0A6G4XJA6_9ACTN|nr:hypothetical protein [Streptomyces mesophilus]NGO77313.1 hypothetical protein [Streptomyces mesophilus]